MNDKLPAKQTVCFGPEKNDPALNAKSCGLILSQGFLLYLLLQLKTKLIRAESETTITPAVDSLQIYFISFKHLK